MLTLLLLPVALAGAPAGWMVSLVDPLASPRELPAWTAAVREAQEAALECIGPTRVLHRYTALPVLHVELDAAGRRRATQCAGVEAVTRPWRYRPHLTESVALVRADVAHDALGLTGLGTAIAIVDSGADVSQSDLAGKVVYGLDVADGDTDVADCNGHGTNVAAIAAGHRGVAPGADLVVYKVFGGASCGDSSDADLAAALDDVVLRAATYGIVAVNMSLGTDDYRASADCDGTGTATETAIRTVHRAGVSVVVSAGNDGDPDGVSFPACLRRVVTVANSYDAAHGAASYCTDAACRTTCSDAAGPVDALNCTSNGGALVELAAPGTTIVAGGQTMSGTSQAGPHVAGAVAVLREAAPWGEPDDVSLWLRRSDATVVDARSGSSVDYPRLDLVRALTAELEDASVSGVVLHVSGELRPGAEATVDVTLANGGPGALAGVTLTLSSGAEDMFVDTSPIGVPEIPAGGSVVVEGLPVAVAASCVTEQEAVLTATLARDGVEGDTGTRTLQLLCVVDDDGDGAEVRDDCDDLDPTAFPGAAELCDGVDQDCDGAVDEEAIDTVEVYPDLDGDGVGDAAQPLRACASPDGYVLVAGDCDDSRADTHPGAPETCDGTDQDCDAEVDEDATDRVEGWADGDGDGFGDARKPRNRCPGEGMVDNALDCDDADPARGELCADAAGCGCHAESSSRTPMVGSVIAAVAWLLVRRRRAGVA